jgi:hypothetical protein
MCQQEIITFADHFQQLILLDLKRVPSLIVLILHLDELVSLNILMFNLVQHHHEFFVGLVLSIKADHYILVLYQTLQVSRLVALLILKIALSCSFIQILPIIIYNSRKILYVIVVIVSNRLTVLIIVLKGSLWLLRHLWQQITLLFYKPPP